MHVCYVRHVYPSLESTGTSPDLYPQHFTCSLHALLIKAHSKGLRRCNGRVKVTCNQYEQYKAQVFPHSLDGQMEACGLFRLATESHRDRLCLCQTTRQTLGQLPAPLTPLLPVCFPLESVIIKSLSSEVLAHGLDVRAPSEARGIHRPPRYCI